MGVIFGTAPVVPQTVTAETLAALRSPGGDAPCADEYLKALSWIGNRELDLGAALGEASRVGLDARWAERALGITGYGDGAGAGAGDGYGYGDGDGDGEWDRPLPPPSVILAF